MWFLNEAKKNKKKNRRHEFFFKRNKLIFQWNTAQLQNHNWGEPEWAPFNAVSTEWTNEWMFVYSYGSLVIEFPSVISFYCNNVLWSWGSLVQIFVTTCICFIAQFIIVNISYLIYIENNLLLQMNTYSL